MIDGGGGKIINVSSIFGGVGTPSKVMDALTKDLAVKWAKYHISVNAVAPAFIEADLTRETMRKSGAHILSHIPLDRFGVPADLKGVVVFLSSAASDYVTGTVLFVDGGYGAM